MNPLIYSSFIYNFCRPGEIFAAVFIAVCLVGRAAKARVSRTWGGFMLANQRPDLSDRRKGGRRQRLFILYPTNLQQKVYTLR